MFWVTWKDAAGKEHTVGNCDDPTADEAAVLTLVEYYRDHKPPSPVGPVLVREGETFDPAAPAIAYLTKRLPAAIVAWRADRPNDEPGRRLEVAEAQAAYWCAEYTVATNAPRSRAAKEASVASDEAQAKLKALGAKP